MPRRLFVFDPPDRFVAGAVGEPGQRSFYLQASKGDAHVSVALEKVQVQLLAQRVAQLLAEVKARGADVPVEGDRTDVDRDPLREPLISQFTVGAMILAWDGADESIVVEAREELESDEEEEPIEIADDDPEGPDLLRVRIPPATALAFAERAAEVVAAGRPPCPLCGQPLDPQGHLCPRRNGYLN
jgi:uncharacterized repeat protein (TIGR03847 family)